jgi:hypothetical protein
MPGSPTNPFPPRPTFAGVYNGTLIPDAANPAVLKVPTSITLRFNEDGSGTLATSQTTTVNLPAGTASASGSVVLEDYQVGPNIINVDGDFSSDFSSLTVTLIEFNDPGVGFITFESGTLNKAPGVT